MALRLISDGFINFNKKAGHRLISWSAVLASADPSRLRYAGMCSTRRWSVGMSSRLFQEVRLRETGPRVYSIYSFILSYLDAVLGFSRYEYWKASMRLSRSFEELGQGRARWPTQTEVESIVGQEPAQRQMLIGLVNRQPG